MALLPQVSYSSVVEHPDSLLSVFLYFPRMMRKWLRRPTNSCQLYTQRCLHHLGLWVFIANWHWLHGCTVRGKKRKSCNLFPLSFLHTWRGAQNKALSDTMSWYHLKFSFCFTGKYKAIWKENLVVHQISPRAFFHATLLCLLVYLYFPPFLAHLTWAADTGVNIIGEWYQTCKLNLLCVPNIAPLVYSSTVRLML